MARKVKDFEYKRVDIAGACEYLEKATARVKAAKSAQEIADIRAEVNRKSIEWQTMSALAYIRHSINVNDKFYSDEQDYYDENLPALSAKSTAFTKALVESKYIDELGKIINPIIIDNAKARVRIMDERIVDDCVEENKLTTEYNKLLAKLVFDVDGKGYTLEEDREFSRRSFGQTRRILR